MQTHIILHNDKEFSRDACFSCEMEEDELKREVRREANEALEYRMGKIIQGIS